MILVVKSYDIEMRMKILRENEVVRQKCITYILKMVEELFLTIMIVRTSCVI